MSQHRLTGLTPGGKVDVLLGWDSPMSWFFLVIEPESDEPLYSNLYEQHPESLDLGVGLGNGNYCTLGAFFNRY